MWSTVDWVLLGQVIGSDPLIVYMAVVGYGCSVRLLACGWYEGLRWIRCQGHWGRVEFGCKSDFDRIFVVAVGWFFFRAYGRRIEVVDGH